MNTIGRSYILISFGNKGYKAQMLHIKLHSKNKHAKKFELHEPKYHNYILARKKNYLDCLIIFLSTVSYAHVKKVKSVLFQVAHSAWGNSSFHSMKWPRVSLLPPGWDASPLEGNPPAFNQATLTIGQYPFILLGGEGHCQGKVSCPRTQHNDPARSSTSTTCQVNK